jgi:rhodanese-related sulfurtransferase
VIGVHRAIALAALLLGGAAAASESLGPTHADRITAVSLAERIKAGERLRLFDLRSEDDFGRFHVPSAERATVDEVAGMGLPKSTPIVVYAGDGEAAAHAQGALRARGYRDVTSLSGGLHEWITRVHEPLLAADATTGERAQFERRAVLSRYFGGQPRVDVPRAEIPEGYWTAGTDDGSRPSMATALLVAAIRRRGC